MLRPTFPAEKPAWKVEVERMLTSLKRSFDQAELALEQMSQGAFLGGMDPGADTTRKKVGYELGRGAWVHTIGIDADYVELLMDDVSQISECSLVFCGAVGCNQAVWFDPADWATVAAWVASGGRLWINGEYEPCLEGDAAATLNAFLSSLGTSLRWVGGLSSTLSNYSPGIAAIASGQTFRMGGSAEVSGGTSVWLDPDDATVTVAAEAVGSGFIFLCGDSDVFDGVYSMNAPFAERLYEAGSGEIL